MNAYKMQKQFTSLQNASPSQKGSFWSFFNWTTCLLLNVGSWGHSFAWQKKHVPYKSTLGFYKIQKFYKNTAHLQKYVLKLGLGKHFSYWARRSPQAQPFGSGNFDPHPKMVMNWGWLLKLGLTTTFWWFIDGSLMIHGEISIEK